jgi:glucosamine 6-phosphate synthetase-like amidotransferase/phosphosugar isomerase protein
MLHYVHNNIIYNSQKLKRTQISFNRGMDTENIVHLHNRVLFSY